MALGVLFMQLFFAATGEESSVTVRYDVLPPSNQHQRSLRWPRANPGSFSHSPWPLSLLGEVAGLRE